METVVRHCDGDLPPVAAHLVDGLDLVARLVLVTLEEDFNIVFETLRRKFKKLNGIELNELVTDKYQV